ncbi:MAG: hypothetical protein P4L53_20850 [Candidatus Obscuribacterales bacterium]|nr:hypothetical protein [Candidatus Obscuribacterales bacterium]
MSDAKPGEKSDSQLQTPEKLPLKSPDAHAVQNASNEQIKAVQSANLDRHNGSAGGSAPESIQIFMGDGRIASRLSTVTEKDNAKPDKLDLSKSISLTELLEKQEREKDSTAQSLVAQFEKLSTMRKGPVRDTLEKEFQDTADKIYGRGKYAPQNTTAKPAPETASPENMKKGHVEYSLQLTRGIQSQDDLQQLAHGIFDGPLNYLSTKDSVHDSLIEIGPALDTAVDYYSEKLRNADGKGLAQDAQTFGEAIVGVVSHTLEQLQFPQDQAQIGSQAAAMAAFFFVGSKVPIEAQAAKQLGLETMTQAELTKLGIESAIATVKNGERLVFSAESGIEVTKATGEELNSLWGKPWGLRGFEGENLMGRSDILPRNFPQIDDAVFKDGIFTDMKTVDLNAPTYQNMEALSRRLNRFVDKLNDWTGEEKLWGGRGISPLEIEQKVLQIGIPNGSMSSEQVAVFEQFGKRASALGIKVKVTAIE